MTGRPSKLRRRRDTAAPGLAPGPAAEQPTIVAPAVPAPLFVDAPPAPSPPAGSVLPADVAADAAAVPGFRERGRYRRRLRYLRRVRELGFRDLGGLVFDLHRFGRKGDEIVRAKLVALDAVDRELRALERVLRDQRDFTDLREPGVAACPRCGGLHGSDARFCPSCGLALSGPTALGVPASGASQGAAPPPASMPPIPVASPIMPLPEPEPGEPAAPEPAPAPDAEPASDGESVAGPDAAAAPGPPVTASAASAGSTPVSAAASGLPVPGPPVPPLPGTANDADADADAAIGVHPPADAGGGGR